jgi:hypothetical protein
MYKKQMTLQRITSFILLAAAVLVFVYSLGIMTNLHDTLALVSTYAESSRNYVKGATIFLEMQPFNRELTTAGIILILSAVALFVFRSNDRRRYYIANYITIGINAVANVAVSIWALINVFAYKAQYLQIDFEKLKTVAEKYDVLYNKSTFWFDASIAVFGFVFLATALSIANLVFKVILMRAEKKLIEEGKEA